MYKILFKKTLAQSIHLMRIEAPQIARKRKAGQFVILRLHDRGERVPLTMTTSDTREGSISIVFQEVGKTSMELAKMKQGDSILDVAGPLGNPTHIEKIGTVVCIGGGLGVAPVYPIAVAMKEAGNKVISIIGARTKDLLIMENEMHAASDELLISTDDGSYGFFGFVSQVLQGLIDKKMPINQVVTIGPVPMMRAVCEVTRPHNLSTMVSLNPIMVDGTGMCGVCRVTIGGQMKFGCVDGPEFDGFKVDFAELSKRLRSYIEQEKISLDKFKCTQCAAI